MKTVKLVVTSSHTLGGGAIAEVGDRLEVLEPEARYKINRGLAQLAPDDPPPAGAGAGPDPGPASPDASGSAGAGGPNATDNAIALARANDVDLSQVAGSGADGRITQPDVQKFIDAR